MWETVGWFLKQLNIELLALLLLELKTGTQTNTGTRMFIPALFTSQKVETMQMPISGWVDRRTVTYTFNRIFFSHNKERSTDTWMNLKSIRLNESRHKKVSCCLIPFIGNI